MQKLSYINPYRFFLLFIMLTLLGFRPASAQEVVSKVPIPVEFMAGNDRLFFQMVIKKKFLPESRFGFLSVSSVALGHNQNMEDLDIAIPTVITYNISKRFALAGGANINNKVSHSPLIGMQHSFVNRQWVSVTMASLFLNSTRSIELFGIYEYKPSITPNLNLYNRVQFLYTHNTRQDFHTRSFLQLRSGIKIKSLNFGAGVNLDQYGSEKVFRSNYGIFIGWDFQ